MSNTDLIERLKKAANVVEDQALAEIFGMSKSAFSYAKKNCSFSIGLMIEFAEKYDCDLNWILLGESKEKKLDTSERMLLTAFADLDDSQKMQAVLFLGNLASGNPMGLGGEVSQTISNSTAGNIAGGNIQQGARFYFEDDE